MCHTLAYFSSSCPVDSLSSQVSHSTYPLYPNNGKGEEEKGMYVPYTTLCRFSLSSKFVVLTYIIISINPPSPRMRRRRTENMLWVLYLHVIYPLLTIMLLTKCCYSFLTCCNKITNVEAHQEKVSIFHCHILSSANLMIVLDSQNNIYYIPHHATHTPLVLTCEHRTRRGVQVEAVPM